MPTLLTFTIAISAVLIGMALFQGVAAAVFVRLFFKSAPPRQPDAELPRVSILLSLRGADPHLAQGLQKLMSQDYPHYELRIVVDSQEDPSCGVVRQAVARTGFQKVAVSPLHSRSDRCGLKNAALVQMAGDLPPEAEVVVLADADLVSHAGWLRELVAPLADPRVGAAHGNRWFWPRRASFGSLVRYLWNSAAVVPMYALEIPWGGTFAIRAEVLRDSGLLDKWSKSVVEDAPVRTALAERGLRLKFVPSLMMVNREECNLPFSLDFIKRQMTWTKIYHPQWIQAAAHAVATSLVLAGAFVMLAVGLLTGQNEIAAWAGGGLAAYAAGMLLLLALIETGVRRVIRTRGEAVHQFSPGEWLKIIAAIPLTQAVYLAAVLLAMFRSTVAWRGVIYEIRGPWDIRLIQYRPYEQATPTANANVSL
ncbi:MAG: glycosyltransferase family 2 protein [Pirellulales bacterium]